MNEQFKEQITYKAREFATAYTNRHFPNEPAFAFGNEGWAAFVDALVALSHPKSNLADSDVIAAPVAGAHPDKGTSALAVPVVPATWASAHWLQELERLAEKMMRDSWATGNDAAWKPGMAALLAHAATSPQAAPVAQLSELPKLAFDESHIDYIDRYDGFCRDCADEDGVCPSSGLPCGGSKKAIRHVLTALAYGVNHGYIPVILCAAPTTPKEAS